MIKKIKQMLAVASTHGEIFDILNNKDYEGDRFAGELIRNVHSIEKGLSLNPVRLGFGYEKIMKAFDYVKHLENDGNLYHEEAILMFADALAEYIEFHKKKQYSDNHIEEIEACFSELNKIVDVNRKYGGTLRVEKKAYSDDELNIIRSLFNERHSIRDFADEPVPLESIYEAVALAHHCPSACNRQCYRVHIVDKKDFAVFENWFEGIGGFADKIDKMLLITGKVSCYRESEHMQWIVSGSVFAAYMTLALQTVGLGGCFIQRPVIPTQGWKSVKQKLNIQNDEQIVCAIGVGVLKDRFNVPISHRLDLKEIITLH